MQFVDPRSEPATTPDPYDLAAPLEAGATIGLFANGFPDSVAFLGHVQKALSELVPGISFVTADKGNASRVASDDEVSTLADRCDAVVAAYGH